MYCGKWVKGKEKWTVGRITDDHVYDNIQIGRA